MAGVKGMKQGSKTQVTSFAQKMLEYLDKNFHKFTPEKQAKIAEAFALKAMPTQVNSDINQKLEANITENDSDLITNKVREVLRNATTSAN